VNRLIPAVGKQEFKPFSETFTDPFKPFKPFANDYFSCFNTTTSLGPTEPFDPCRRQAGV
jgi:hypothetical protein